MRSIKDVPVEQRPRERLLTMGAAGLSDQDLLAVLLGRGTAQHDVLSLARQLVGRDR